MPVSTGRGGDGDRESGLEAAGMSEVFLHLRAERVQAGKPLIRSNPSKQMDLQRESVEFAIGGLQEVNLAARLHARQRRPGTDVDERVRGDDGAECVGEVDPRGGEHDVRVHGQIGGWKPECPADPVTGPDGPEKHRRPAEKLRGLLDLPGLQVGADSRAADGSA